MKKISQSGIIRKECKTETRREIKRKEIMKKKHMGKISSKEKILRIE